MKGKKFRAARLLDLSTVADVCFVLFKEALFQPVHPHRSQFLRKMSLKVG